MISVKFLQLCLSDSAGSGRNCNCIVYAAIWIHYNKYHQKYIVEVNLNIKSTQYGKLKFKALEYVKTQ